jgi:CO/xanthine dehydrogenase Mo-binding subunit
MARFLGTSFPTEDLPGLANEDASLFVRGIEDPTGADFDAVMARSAVIVEETVLHQCQTHHPLESRSAMSYWQNGTCYVHCSVQSAARVAASYANRLGLEPENFVMISEFCGGAFGSKIGGSLTDMIPAELSRRINRPVMMRVTRDEETYFGRARSGMQGWVKMGFREDGKLLAMDLVLVQDAGPFGAPGDVGGAVSTADLALQPEARRARTISISTNTPPRAAQRGPGGAQIIPMLTTALERGARELGVDRVDMMYLNAPEGRAVYGNNASEVTSSFAKEAVLLGRERFNWDEKKLLSGQRNGSKVTGVGVALSPYSAGSRGMDGLLIIRPDGKVTIHSGVGNLGTHSVFDTAMAAVEVLGVPWDEVDVVWGNSSLGLAWASSQSGSQTTHAHTRANFATGQDAKQKLQEIAARDLGGTPANYDVGNGRVFRVGSPSTGMTFAQAAQRAIQLGGRYDGHELSEDLNEMTVRTIQTHLVGQGLVAAARDNYGGDGALRSTVVSFAVIELDTETGMFDIKEMLSVADVGTVLNPRNLNAQMGGGVLQGMSHARFEKWGFDRQWGVNQNKRFYTVKPFSILDVPEEMTYAAVDIADPETPVGSRGVGEPPVGAGAGVIVSAVYDAVGKAINRTPLTPDRILNALEDADPGYTLLQTNI